MDNQTKHGIIKKSFWIAAAFYCLIAFEFFYMVSPFAVYFYSIYKPGLTFVNDVSALGWLSDTFLPHIVAHTSSPLIKLSRQAGIVLAPGGFILFVIGAAQVYFHKLTGRKAVTGGIYRFIRHPQYTALAVSGLGLLMLWPRYLVLLSFITMLFFYYFLARHEEAECRHKFGKPYDCYLEKTGMFLPFRFSSPFHFPFSFKIPALKSVVPQAGVGRIVLILSIYLVSCTLGVAAAVGIKEWSLDRVYALYEKDTATISVTRLDTNSILEILTLARSQPEYRREITSVVRDHHELPAKHLHYIMPTDWSASEIPMTPVSVQSESGESPHGYPEDRKIDRYKIVLTRATQRNGENSIGKDIMHNTVARIPLLEMTVDLKKGEVLDIAKPATGHALQDVPLPLY